MDISGHAGSRFGDHAIGVMCLRIDADKAAAGSHAHDVKKASIDGAADRFLGAVVEQGHVFDRQQAAVLINLLGGSICHLAIHPFVPGRHCEHHVQIDAQAAGSTATWQFQDALCQHRQNENGAGRVSWDEHDRENKAGLSVVIKEVQSSKTLVL